MQQYRIRAYHNRVHVQKQWTFLWWRGWSYVKAYSRDAYEYRPVNFLAVEGAKEYIDNQLAQELAWSLPPIITPYPAPS